MTPELYKEILTGNNCFFIEIATCITTVGAVISALIRGYYPVSEIPDESEKDNSSVYLSFILAMDISLTLTVFITPCTYILHNKLFNYITTQSFTETYCLYYFFAIFVLLFVILGITILFLKNFLIRRNIGDNF